MCLSRVLKSATHAIPLSLAAYSSINRKGGAQEVDQRHGIPGVSTNNVCLGSEGHLLPVQAVECTVCVGCRMLDIEEANSNAVGDARMAFYPTTADATWVS